MPVADFFVQALLRWNKKENKRQMPWKGEKDPYKIWLSEIILQQTRVEQGLKYYENFIKTFPHVDGLAKAPPEKIFKLWEGLGYYSRCKNLIETATHISTELKGVFPSEYNSILKLKGVGVYTAAAIASFAYNLPFAVVDGNVLRVLSRIFDIDTPIDTAEGKKEFSALAQSMLPKLKAGEYNQAIMDFGAVICKPLPLCESCFFASQCKAFLQGKQLFLPVKKNKVKIKERWLNYLILRYKDEVAVRQRITKDIWQQLFEFLLIETPKPASLKKVLKEFEKQYSGTDYFFISSLKGVKQKLTHQTICFNFIVIGLNNKEPVKDFLWVSIPSLNQIAFPKTLKKFIAEHLNEGC